MSLGIWSPHYSNMLSTFTVGPQLSEPLWSRHMKKLSDVEYICQDKKKYDEAYKSYLCVLINYLIQCFICSRICYLLEQ